MEDKVVTKCVTLFKYSLSLFYYYVTLVQQRGVSPLSKYVQDLFFFSSCTSLIYLQFDMRLENFLIDLMFGP